MRVAPADEGVRLALGLVGRAAGVDEALLDDAGGVHLGQALEAAPEEGPVKIAALCFLCQVHALDL